MSSDALTREALVEALDDLGERAKMAEVWTKDTNVPYPPEAVHKRSKRLRWYVRGRRIGATLLALLVLVTGAMDWSIPDDILLGLGAGLLPASLLVLSGVENLPADHIRALQLYDLLKQVDGDSEPVA